MLVQSNCRPMEIIVEEIILTIRIIVVIILSFACEFLLTVLYSL